MQPGIRVLLRLVVELVTLHEGLHVNIHAQADQRLVEGTQTRERVRSELMKEDFVPLKH